MDDMQGKCERMMREIRTLTDRKVLFRIHPVHVTTQELDGRVRGMCREEMERVAEELARSGRIYYGRTLNEHYCRIMEQQSEIRQERIMKEFMKAIQSHLDKVAGRDEAFALRYQAKREAEPDSIENCCRYIIGRVQQKYKKSGSAVLTSTEVFGMAQHYYDEDIKDTGKAVKCDVVVAKESLTEEEQQEIRLQARRDAEQAVYEEEQEKIRQEKKREEETARKAEEQRRRKEEAAAKRAAEKERKRQEEQERRRKEWETADCLFPMEEDEV